MKPMRQIGAEKLLLLSVLALIASPIAAAGWQLIGEGDCPGRQVIGSLGIEPEAELCSPEFAGKTALCFTQVCNPGCQYIDVATADCRGGGELALVYTCEPEPAADQVLEASGK